MSGQFRRPVSSVKVPLLPSYILIMVITIVTGARTLKLTFVVGLNANLTEVLSFLNNNLDTESRRQEGGAFSHRRSTPDDPRGAGTGLGGFGFGPQFEQDREPFFLVLLFFNVKKWVTRTPKAGTNGEAAGPGQHEPFPGVCTPPGWGLPWPLCGLLQSHVRYS